MHGRAQIRAAIAAALSSLATPVTVRVEARRRLDPVTDLPAVIVGMGEDTANADMRAMGPYVVERTQNVMVELHATGADGDTIAGVLDQMDLEVEAALAADLTLGGITEIIEPVTSVAEWTDDQDTLLGSRLVTYAVIWRHDFGAPDVPEG